ncbi:MAG: hypothetical protein ACJAUV_000001, partial [Flavobacteriales bacterium]
MTRLKPKASNEPVFENEIPSNIDDGVIKDEFKLMLKKKRSVSKQLNFARLYI